MSTLLTTEPAAIPILGQPFKVVSGTVVATIECQCAEEGKQLVVLAMGTFAECPKCHKVYSISKGNIPMAITVTAVGKKD